MRRAVAFCQSIKVSQKIASTFNVASESYVSELPTSKQGSMQIISSKHIDRIMNVIKRNILLAWLKEDADANQYALFK
jgi:predicted helicase